MLSYADNYIISWQFTCPGCRRAWQVTGRTYNTGWEQAEDFNYRHAPFPNFEPRLIAWVLQGDEPPEEEEIELDEIWI